MSLKYPRVIAGSIALVFAVLLFMGAGGIGFAADIDFLNLQQIVIQSLVLLLVPGLLGLVLSRQAARSYDLCWAMMIVLPIPLGFSLGFLPNSASLAQLAAVSLPVLLPFLLLLAYWRRQ